MVLSIIIAIIVIWFIVNKTTFGRLYKLELRTAITKLDYDKLNKEVPHVPRSAYRNNSHLTGEFCTWKVNQAQYEFLINSGYKPYEGENT